MNYEVTATRKRPRSFDSLVGQEFVVASLRTRSLRAHRARVSLLRPARGRQDERGRAILARALNCPDGPDADGCEEYPGSEEIARGTSIDVIEIDGASNTSVNDVRQIKDEVLFAPTAARYKIYIIDEVHMLSNSAFNALLKTIEEPPPYIVFIFATTEIHKVPATIRSRCQQFNFRLIPVDEVKAKLAEVAAEMSVGADDEALFWIAKEATGSLRDAYTLFDQVVSFSEGYITLEKIREKLGLVGLDNLNEIADAIADGDGQRLVELADEIISRGVSVEQFTIDLAEYFRSILFIHKGIHKESLLGFSPDRFSGKMLRSLTDTQVEHALELMLALYRTIRYSLNPRFDLDLVLSKLASLRDYLTSKEILREMEDLRESLSVDGADATPPRGRPSGASPGRTSGGAAAAPDDPATARPQRDAPAASPETAAPERAGAGDDPASGHEREETTAGRAEPSDAPILADAPSDPLDDDHHPVAPPAAHGLRPEQAADIILRIRPSRLALSSALEKATRWSLAESELRIFFDSEYPANAARGEEEVIRNAAADVLGKPVLVRIRVDAGEGAPEEESHDEQVEMVKRVFRGEIVDGQT